ncbi:MAG: hypothetical protein NC937_00350 [Candidatus Omnitrophica bacterium]|nr:hypothetical protein [Candidatus Omnitrophota bacterium]MCM8824591.1 hypothetical protein [Candidatus Omnitrophota bacterium]
MRKSSVKLLPFLGSLYNDKNPVNFLKRAIEMTNYPVDGFSFWDGVDVRTDPVFHMLIEGLVSKKAIKETMEKLEKFPTYRTVITLQGTKVNKHSYKMPCD